MDVDFLFFVLCSMPNWTVFILRNILFPLAAYNLCHLVMEENLSRVHCVYWVVI